MTTSVTDPTPGGAPVPSPLGRKVLLFSFLVLAEYWLAPLLFDISNYAGTWSTVGNVLFVFFLAVLAVFVVRPLVPHLRAALSTGRRHLLFHGLWAGSLALGLAATNLVRFDPATSPPASLLALSAESPFGFSPSVQFTTGPLGLVGGLDVVSVTVLGLLSVLWASAVLMTLARRSVACEVVPASTGWRARIGSLAVWGPFGFITGCSTCTPVYLAVLGVFAPGVAASGYSSMPLVPWIGFTGLLYLVSFGLIVRLFGRLTRPAPLPSVPVAPEPRGWAA